MKCVKLENNLYNFFDDMGNLIGCYDSQSLDANIQYYQDQILLFNKHIQYVNLLETAGLSEYDSLVHGVWHDPNSVIKIVMTFEQNTLLISEHPELLAYIKNDPEILYKIENGYVYIYVNFFEDGHREILESFGALIFDMREDSPITSDISESPV